MQVYTFENCKTIGFVSVTFPVQLDTQEILFGSETTHLKNSSVFQDFKPNEVKTAVFAAPYNFGFASGTKVCQSNAWNFSEI
jgi:hypothetical protein